MTDQANDEPLYRVRFATRPSTAIVEALATVTEQDPAALDPLYETVDLESLDTLFRNPKGMQIPGEVRFPAEGYVFEVTSDGWITVYEAETVATEG